MSLVPQLAFTSAERSFHTALIVIHEARSSADDKAIWLCRTMNSRISALGILKFYISKSLGLARGVVASHSDTALNNFSARNKGVVYGGLVGIVREIPHKDNATIVRLIARFASSGIGLHRRRCGARPRSIWLLDCDVPLS
jgi:hypothetical protein